MSLNSGSAGLPFDLIDEAAYAQTMNQTVLPVLQACAQDDWLPVQGQGGGIHSRFFGRAEFRRVVSGQGPVGLATAGDRADAAGTGTAGTGTAGAAAAADGTAAGTGAAAGAGRAPHGTVVISHGFTESALKFSEMTWYFLQAGYDVLVIEHRGHGKSLRENADPRVVSIHDWHDYIGDFIGVLKRARLRYHMAAPLLLFGHSMGAAIGAAVLESYPRLFTRAVLSSPMMLPQLRMPEPVAYAIAAVGTRSGHGPQKIPFVADFSEEYQPVKSPGRSQARARWYFDRRVEDEDYQTYSPSFDWVRAALELDAAILSPQAIGAIETPTLIFHAEDDHSVRTSAQARFVARARRAQAPIRFLDVPVADHEIFAATNDILAPYLHRVLSFYGSVPGR